MSRHENLTPAASRASAPGKMIICGEYAVLEGHVAVVAAIDRHAHASIQSAPTGDAFFAAARQYLEPHEWARMERIAVDSRELHHGDAKLGLGSSAAAMVAAVSLAIGHVDRKRCLAIAHHAHADFQAEHGARGSGIDIAASVEGGVIAARIGGVLPVDTAPIALPAALALVAVWTGTSAKTPALVARVRQSRNDSQHRLAIASIAAASRMFIDACHAGDARACVAAIHAGGDATLALDRAARVALVTPTHQQIRAIAASRGGSAKPTGAGGGDIALAAFVGQDAALAFRADLELAGIVALDLSVDSTGATVS